MLSTRIYGLVQAYIKAHDELNKAVQEETDGEFQVASLDWVQLVADEDLLKEHYANVFDRLNELLGAGNLQETYKADACHNWHFAFDYPGAPRRIGKWQGPVAASSKARGYGVLLLTKATFATANAPAGVMTAALAADMAKTEGKSNG